MIRLKAKELSSDPAFKASPGWYTKWKRRHAISMRSKPTLAQRLPADMEDKVVQFHRFVLRARQRCGYESSQILNMDETPMRFELPATRTLEFTGTRTVPILSCGGEKQSFTVVLAVKAFVSYKLRCLGKCRFLYTRRPGRMEKVCSVSFVIFAVLNSGHHSFFECLPNFMGARLRICF